jgi:EAL domain-containing protein (putative c-di-GMP-specific phosphodiesterase class I)/GGDEF domain-containing protein
VSSEFDDEIARYVMAFLEQTADFVGVSGSLSEILYLNPAARKRLGIEDLTGKTTADLFPPEAFAQYYEVVRPRLLQTGEWSGEVLVNTAGGSPERMYVSTIAEMAPGGLVNANVVYAHDLPDSESVAPNMVPALDARAGVLDRETFEGYVDAVVSTASRDYDTCALVVVAVDVTTTATAYGADIVGELMRVVSTRIARVARTIDVLGQVGVGTIGVLLRGLRSASEARRVANVIYESLADAPITTSAGALTAPLTIGVALAEPGVDRAELLANARRPIWQAPAGVVDAPARADGTVPSSDAVSVHDFRVAWSQGDICAYARPVVDLASGELVAFQGRARWERRGRRPLGANAFIAMIADSALASPVDLLIAREVAAVLLLRDRMSALRMYTPVSKRLLLDVRTELHITEITTAFHLTMNRINLEVPRDYVSPARPAMRDALAYLREAGSRLVLARVDRPDDAALAAEHGCRELVLARGLDAATAADIVGAARAHDLPVVATGVDTLDQRDALLAAGCDFATGLLYGDLIAADAIE